MYTFVLIHSRLSTQTLHSFFKKSTDKCWYDVQVVSTNILIYKEREREKGPSIVHRYLWDDSKLDQLILMHFIHNINHLSVIFHWPSNPYLKFLESSRVEISIKYEDSTPVLVMHNNSALFSSPESDCCLNSTATLSPCTAAWRICMTLFNSWIPRAFLALSYKPAYINWCTLCNRVRLLLNVCIHTYCFGFQVERSVMFHDLSLHKRDLEDQRPIQLF